MDTMTEYKRLISLLFISLLFALRLGAQQPPVQQSPPRVQLPNGWYLTPAGESVPLSSDLPLNMAIAPDGIHVAVTNNGNGRESIDLINLKQRRRTASVTVKRAWLGLQFSKMHPWLYASGGNDNCIIRDRLAGDSLIVRDSLILGKPWPTETISPTGLVLDERHALLYVVTKEDEALYVFDL